MNLLQILTSFLSNSENSKALINLLADLLNGNFNLENFLKNINIEKVFNILSPLLQTNGANDKSQNQNVGLALKPITPFADKDVVYSLNKYFENTK